MKRYMQVEPISRAEAERLLDTGEPAAMSAGLLPLAYYETDWRWVQDKCLRVLNHPNAEMRGLALTCLGHLARIHRHVDHDRVVPAVQRLLADPLVRGRAEDALDDIRMFAGE